MQKRTKVNRKNCKSRSNKMSGGGCMTTGEFAKAVYGDEQVRASDASNVIASKPVFGGRRKSRQGGGPLTDVIIPAAFIYANNMYQPKRKTVKNTSRKNRGTYKRRR